MASPQSSSIPATVVSPVSAVAPVTAAPSTTTTTPAAAVTPAAAAQPLHTASLYVGDIHPEVTEASLFEIFNAVGPVASIRVCRDAITRRSLGYAYVNFHNVADAERALDTMNFSSIKGVACRIMWSQRDPALRKSGLGNIFIKNLDFSVDNKALYDTFSLFGNILSCKVINDGTGSKGYGYVHYETAEAAEEAIDKINGMLIAGCEVYVGQFQKRQERPDEATYTNCYVKNIPKHWTEENLRSEFQSFGTISSCVVMKGKTAEAKDITASDASTSADTPASTLTAEEVAEAAASALISSRGFGFVNYESPEAAASATDALNGKVFKALDGETEVELFVGKAQKKVDRERDLRQKFETMKIDRINKYQGVNLYVKNLDEGVSDDELREAFSAFGTITSSRVMRDPAGVSRGFGFVCFATPEESIKAVSELNGKLLGGKPMYVALAQRKEVRRAQLEAQHAQQRSAAGLMTGGPQGRGLPMGGPNHPMFGHGAPMFYAQPNQMPSQGMRQGGPQGQGGFMYPQGQGGPQLRGPMGGPGPYGGQHPQQGGPVMQGRSPYGNASGPMMGGPQGGYASNPMMQQASHGGRGGGPGRGGPGRGPYMQGGQHMGGRGGGRNNGPNNNMGMPQHQQGGRGNMGNGNGNNGQFQNRNFKYTANARNHPARESNASQNVSNGGPSGPSQQQPSSQLPGAPVSVAPVAAPVAVGVPPLTSAQLVNANEEQQKNMIGERLYPLIHQEQPTLAGKITGMLLEMDNGELLVLLESREALMAKIHEAMQVLEAHSNEVKEAAAAGTD